MYDDKIKEGLISIAENAKLPQTGHLDGIWKRLATINTQPGLGQLIQSVRSNHWAGACPTRENAGGQFAQPSLFTSCKVWGVDGSQIYPDMFSPLRWGYVRACAYATAEAPRMASEFVPDKLLEDVDDFLLHQYIDARRSALEISLISNVALNATDENTVVLADNPLLPFIAPGCENLLRVYKDYLLTAKNRLVAGITLRPQSRLLINLIRLADAGEPVDTVRSGISDLVIMAYGLPEKSRSAVYRHASPRNEPFEKEGAGICFFFLKVDGEVMRVEVPEWVARDDSSLDRIHDAVLSSCIAGFPYQLSQAHRSVVVSVDEASAYAAMAENLICSKSAHYFFAARPNPKEEAKR